MDTIQKLKWNVLPHPLYRPDLAPSDYQRSGPLKEHLGRKMFCNNEEVMQDVQEWLHWQPKDFFLRGICKLPDCWRKCIATQGDYVNKKVQLGATICRHLFTARSLYMFRVSRHPSSGVLKTVTATSGIGHNAGTTTSFQRGLIRPCWKEVAVPTL